MHARKEGRNQIYELSPEGLTELHRAMEEVQGFWILALDAYKRHTEEQ